MLRADHPERVSVRHPIFCHPLFSQSPEHDLVLVLQAPKEISLSVAVVIERAHAGLHNAKPFHHLAPIVAMHRKQAVRAYLVLDDLVVIIAGCARHIHVHEDPLHAGERCYAM